MFSLGLLKSLLGVCELNELNVLKVCSRTRLIDKVDSLIREVSVSDVSLGCLNGKLDYFIRICDIMMLLIIVLNALQYLDGHLDGRFIQHDLLETSLKG